MSTFAKIRVRIKANFFRGITKSPSIKYLNTRYDKNNINSPRYKPAIIS